MTKLKTKEALAYLESKGCKIHLNTYHTCIRDGRIGAKRSFIGKSFVVEQEDLDKFIEVKPIEPKQ